MSVENLEKVEKLRERADVTYEEARDALEANGWDLLDAIVALEKAGKTGGPSKSSYSTEYEAQSEYVSVAEKVEEKRAEIKERKVTVRSILRKFVRICTNNSLQVLKGTEEIIKLPLWACVLLLLMFWKPVLVLVVVSLFLGVRYRFVGKDPFTGANDFMASTEKVIDRVKAEFKEKV